MPPSNPQQALAEAFPWIPWWEPLPVQSAQNPHLYGYACRFCIAHTGLPAKEIGDLFKTPQDCQAHIDEVHPK